MSAFGRVRPRKLLPFLQATRHNSFPATQTHSQVLFCRLTASQRSAYLSYISSREVTDVLNGRALAFRPVTNLRKLCNHVDLMSGSSDRDRGSGSRFVPDDVDGGALLSGSGKLGVAAEIMRMWRVQGHRCLLFCQGRTMLTLLEAFVRNSRWPYLRMDGETAIGDRQALVDKFNRDPSVFAFLLTTRVGGVGKWLRPSASRRWGGG